MRKVICAIIGCSVIIGLIMGEGLSISSQREGIGTLSINEVQLAPNCIIMPIGRILLIRKDSDYCVVKFTEFLTGNTKEDLYTRYESYYQEDKTGDFTNKNVKFRKEELHWPKPSWSLFGHPVAFDTKDEIRCGPIKLWWTGKGAVYFFKRDQPQGDYGIELAPTPWTDISQVNVFDKRIKWYRYDDNRKDEYIPINKLWEDTQQEKEK